MRRALVLKGECTEEESHQKVKGILAKFEE